MILRVLEGGVEVRLLVALPDRDVVRHELPRAEHVFELVEDLRVRVVGDLVVFLHAVAVGIARELARGRDLVRMREVVGDRFAEVVASELVAHRHARLAGGQCGATLGEDLHHAVGGVRAVQRARGGTLDDFDALDVFGVDVGEREARDRAINDDERILAARERRRTAETDARGRARLAVHRRHTRTSHAAGEGPKRGRGRCFLDLRIVDRCHRERGLLLRRRVRHTCRDHGFEIQHVLLELEVLLAPAGGECDRATDRTVPDAAREQAHRLAGARGIDGEGVASLLVGDGAGR